MLDLIPPLKDFLYIWLLKHSILSNKIELLLEREKKIENEIKIFINELEKDNTLHSNCKQEKKIIHKIYKKYRYRYSVHNTEKKP